MCICCSGNVRTSHVEIRSKIWSMFRGCRCAGWILLDLPKNANGKIDRRKIQELFAAQDAEKLVLKQPDLDGCCATVIPGKTEMDDLNFAEDQAGMNVVLAAEESAGLQMLRSLVHSKHNLVGVLAEVPKLGAARGSVGNVRGNLAAKPGRAARAGSGPGKAVAFRAG